MKKLFTILSAILMAAVTVSAQRRQCIDADWHFFLGDGSAVLTTPSVAAQWRSLALPHDWSVEPEAAAQAGGDAIGPFSSKSIGGYRTGHTVGGEGWYERTLNITAGDLDGRVVLYFEGAYNQSWTYVNGTLAGTNVYGYSSFRYDITDLLHEGANSLVVKVVNAGNNSRWYAGSGIYRHVWLQRMATVHVDEWDTFLTLNDEGLTIRDGLATGTLSVKTRLYNEDRSAAKGSVCVDLIDANGSIIASGSTRYGKLAAGRQQDIDLSLPLTNARTWSPEQPVLYDAVISVKDRKGHTLDALTKRIGLRSLAFSATDGFRLNGEDMLLRGGCVHHDNGLLGAAAFDKAETRKLRLLKAQGFNAVRTSHNPPSEHFLDACDELGLMVIDECFDQWVRAKNPDDYHNFFPTHSDDDMSTLVRRDRNHPSVIIWSIGNEIPGRIDPEGTDAAARLRADIRKLDTTRPVTAAICGWDEGSVWDNAGKRWEDKWKVENVKAFESLDIGGYNYLFGRYEPDHATNPDRVMCGLESYAKQASENWTMVERLPYVIGDFVWTAVDYLGESGIGAAYADREPNMFFQDWPWFNANCGDIDLIGQKKPQSYYRDVVWRQAPVTMAVQVGPSHNNGWGWQLEEQSWTWPGHEGENVTVNVYSRASRVRLYLNQELIGEQSPNHTFWTAFNLPYQPGTLRAVNLDAEGHELPAEAFVLETTGPAVGVRCVYEDTTLSADVNDLAFVTLELVDAEGRTITSDCQTQITISNEGAGELIACGTAHPSDMRSFRSTTPTLFRGRALAILRSNGTVGEVKVKAEMVKH
ncbi:MAG: DUF4982 domain-containing protein [Bacteroidaceae bacterium]|nr:DUF4982 domain-containing protein [Bacteroidaceae bacterium]